jgi:hypothetical protein
MKKFITTLEHIWKIKELRNRILFTLAMIGVYRLGTRIVLPGVMPGVLERFTNNRNSNDLLGLINTFTVVRSTTPPSLHWGSCLTSLLRSSSSCLDSQFLISKDYNRKKENPDVRN